MDIMPTLLEVIGKPVPPNLELDGVSLLGHLKSKSCRLKNENSFDSSCEWLHKFMFHHCGTDIFALRWIRMDGQDKNLLISDIPFCPGLFCFAKKYFFFVDFEANCERASLREEKRALWQTRRWAVRRAVRMF